LSDDRPTNARQAVLEEISKKTVYSSFRRTASALEDLSKNTKLLTAELKDSNESSTKLTTSLNRLTFAALVIAAIALVLEIYKLVLPAST
jgi:hypothetical protein